uniref:serine O-acetyltransferase n=1 Tax=Candidatus Kentrum sp. TUN TaxID=2126343 RepID=A0A450ZAH5_9GAMM|nr:MAG: serine O-acetyltransferase [Candidatus Kentron sp. TUN]VFK51046.1 MAG: serine O-acetyltransferase [Candidatus Kentron sp. TUN]VFK52025.1 MAG: serine O-acetyltransferase [Candidatus Kentron sp. TUN]
MFKLLREDIRCIRERDPAARGGFEILTTYPSIHALGLHRISHRLWRRNFKWLARIISAFSRWFTGIEIHPNVTIGERFFIDHGMGVVIGETAEIGDDCTLYQGVTLGGTSWNKGKRHPTLQNGVVVGAGAKILGPIIVRENARVGSNAVVVKNVPAGTTVIGIPGHIIHTHADEEDQSRQAIAEKMGFDAYGISKNLPDPVTNAINRMLDHIHAMDKKVDAIENSVTNLGGEIGNINLPDLEHCEVEPDYPEHDAKINRIDP